RAPSAPLSPYTTLFRSLVAVGLERGLVPARAVFAAAADVGHGVHAALLQPALAHAAGIARGERDLEAAVAVQQGRRLAVMGQVRSEEHKSELPSRENLV